MWVWNQIKRVFGRTPQTPGYRPVRTQEHEDDDGEGSDHPTQQLPLHPIFQKYGLTSAPRHYGGNLREIIEDSVSEGKLVLIYLHSRDHEKTEEFMENVVATREFIDCVQDHFLFYVSDVYQKEGFQLQSQLNLTSCPFLGVLMSTVSRRRKLLALGKIEGKVSSTRICARLNEIYQRALPQIVSDRQESERIRMERQQREQQDQEFEEAMRQDEERELRVRQEEDRKRELERLASEKERIIAHNKINRMELRQRFNEKKQQMDDGNSIRVKFRFPDGSTVQRRFLLREKVAELYEFIHCLDESMGSSWSPKDVSTLQNYTLTINFPRMELAPERTLQEIAKDIHNQIVFVTEIEYNS